ncbi:MAG: hypothetical protein P8L44_09730 [Opitutales bacterium]|nr:hypothetical protein [Opitutales bacterium]
MKSINILPLASALAALFVLQTSGFGQGMPSEQRDTIHGLFDSRDKFQREVTETETGYVSRTTSDDPEAVQLIQTHVKQMEGRLKQGLMVRHWDPAYLEFVNYYDDIDIQITNIEKGISIVAIGKTKEAIEVARNHAGIISKFMDHGWKEHDKTHAAVYSESEATQEMGSMGGMACCQQEGLGDQLAGAACKTEGDGGCMMDAKAEDKGGKMSCCQQAG